MRELLAHKHAEVQAYAAVAGGGEGERHTPQGGHTSVGVAGCGVSARRHGACCDLGFGRLAGPRGVRGAGPLG